MRVHCYDESYLSGLPAISETVLSGFSWTLSMDIINVRLAVHYGILIELYTRLYHCKHFKVTETVGTKICIFL